MPTKKELQITISMLNDALETALAVSPERDNNFFTGGLSELYKDRNAWDRKRIFSESMRAWRVNPLARRIVKLITSFVMGKGLKIKASNTKVQNFLDQWAERNQLHKNLSRWKDEETRTGNLFALFNVLEGGMTIIRMVPAEMIEEIETSKQDIEQEQKYFKDESQIEFYPTYSKGADQSLFMKHYASNKPVGSAWGEADLSPLLVWIGRYSSWLEDRVRLNHFRTAFMYLITGDYTSETDRAAREKSINQNQPKSGSTLVVNRNNGEEWSILSAQLDSYDASVDGLNIKKMISAGVGFPLHYLAEPESATSTTAEAAGTPTFRTLEQMQKEFFDNLLDMARTALEVAGMDSHAEIWIEGSDITERDNATIGLAIGRSLPAIGELLDREAITDEEFLRLVYKMFSEIRKDGPVPKIKRKPLVKTKENKIDPVDPGDPDDPKEEEVVKK